MKPRQINLFDNSHQTELHPNSVIVKITSGFIIIGGKFKGDGTEFLILHDHNGNIETKYCSIPEFIKRTELQKDVPATKIILEHIKKAAHKIMPIIYSKEDETTLAIGIITSKD